MPVQVNYQNGDAVVARPDERELARWEAEHGSATRALTEIPHAFMRFCAFHALRRAGKLDEGAEFFAWCDTVVSIRGADR